MAVPLQAGRGRGLAGGAWDRASTPSHVALLFVGLPTSKSLTDACAPSQHDPFWRGLLPTRVIFRDDGTVTRRPDPDAPEDPGPTLPVNVDITWRFVCQGAGVAGPAGAFVRCRVAGRSVPTYVVSRHASNWGWIMQSCWALYTSFPMPKQGEAGGKLDDDSLAVNINAQEAEAVAYNTGLPLDEDECVLCAQARMMLLQSRLTHALAMAVFPQLRGRVRHGFLPRGGGVQPGCGGGLIRRRRRRGRPHRVRRASARRARAGGGAPAGPHHGADAGQRAGRARDAPPSAINLVATYDCQHHVSCASSLPRYIVVQLSIAHALVSTLPSRQPRVIPTR